MKPVRDFRFKRFTVRQDGATHKVGTDAVLLATWVHVREARRILDIGTGSGVIALILAQRTTARTRIDAVEVQEPDFKQAVLNFSISPWPDRLHAIHSAVQDFRPETKYDLIVSNPPYFRNSQLPPGPARAVVRHSQQLSFEHLLESVTRLLDETGKFGLILPTVEARHFEMLAGRRHLHCIRKCEFRARLGKPVERLLMEYSFRPAPVSKEALILYSQANAWSDEYWTLTSELYLERKV